MKLAIAIDKYTSQKRQSGYKFESGQRCLMAFSRRLGDTDLHQITTASVHSYLSESDSACFGWQFKYGLLSNLFSYWSDRGMMPELAMPGKKPSYRSTFNPYIFNRCQLRELLKSIPRCQQRYRHIEPQTMRMLILLMYGTGATLTDAIHLRYCEVNLGDLLITFSSRGSRYRQIPIGASLGEVFRKYVSWRTKRKLSGNSFLVTKYDQPLSVQVVSRHFEKIRKNAGIVRLDGATLQPRLTDLKHTFAVHRITAWVKDGADLNRMLPALAAYMGQHGLGSTEHYLALSPERFRKELAKLSPARGRRHWRDDKELIGFLSSL